MINDPVLLKISAEFGKRMQIVLRKAKINPIKVKDITRGVKHLTFHTVLSVPNDLKKLRDENVFESVALACNVSHVSVFRYAGIVKISFLLPEKFHTECLYEDTQGKGFGFTDNNVPVEYSFTDVGPHILICGSSGSGKTYCALAMTLSIARTEPGTQFVICDPAHQFYYLKDWLGLAQPLAHTDEEIIRNIDFVFEEYLKRGHLTPPEAEELDRIVLIVDEFESKITDARTLKRFKEMVKNGRKYKVNMIALSQNPNEDVMKGALSGLTQVYLGRVKNKQIASHLTGVTGLHPFQLDQQGDFYQILGSDIVRFQVAKVEDSDFEKLEYGKQTFQHPNLPEEVKNLDVEDITPDLLLKKQPGGRPKTKIDPSVIAYLISNPTVSVRQARKSMNIPSQSNYYAHKNFLDELARTLKEVYNINIFDL